MTSHISISEPTGGRIQSSIIKAQLYCTEIKVFHLLLEGCSTRHTGNSLYELFTLESTRLQNHFYRLCVHSVLIFPVTVNDTHRCNKSLRQNLPQVSHEVFQDINPNQTYPFCLVDLFHWLQFGNNHIILSEQS